MQTYAAMEFKAACAPQIYAEAMQSPCCAAIHLTRIETEFTCDTFMPSIDPAHFRLWSASAPRLDNGVRTAFLCYTRLSPDQPLLPKAVASSHQEFQVLRPRPCGFVRHCTVHACTCLTPCSHKAKVREIM